MFDVKTVSMELALPLDDQTMADRIAAFFEMARV